MVPRTSLSHSEGEEQAKDLSLKENEKAYILRVLKMTGGKIRGTDGAAQLLKIHPNTLYSRMKKLQIRLPSRGDHLPDQQTYNLTPLSSAGDES